MLQAVRFCESCLNWFHPPCVGITPDEAKRVPNYFCPACLRDIEDDMNNTVVNEILDLLYTLGIEHYTILILLYLSI